MGIKGLGLSVGAFGAALSIYACVKARGEAQEVSFKPISELPQTPTDVPALIPDLYDEPLRTTPLPSPKDSSQPMPEESHAASSDQIKVDDPVPTLINGRAADPKEWPASVYANSGNSWCTGTVIGEKVMLIAAHCVGNGSQSNFTIGGVKYSGICSQSPDYRGNSTADWALCVYSQPIVIPEGYESINQNENLMKVGDEVLLTGFGCVNPGGGGGNDGVYRIGEAKIKNMPSGATNNDIVTVGAALCFGDSGGPAFFYTDGALKKSRVQISVNSRGDIHTTSYLVALHTPQAKKFIQDFASQKSVKICGVHADAPNCRGGSNPTPTPTPSPSPIPPMPCHDALAHLEKCFFRPSLLVRTEREKCERSYGFLFQCLEEAVWNDNLQ